MKIRPVPNWRVVMRRSYSFTLATLAALIGVASALHPLLPAVVPYLPPEVAMPLITTLAALAAAGRLLDQRLPPQNPPKEPRK